MSELAASTSMRSARTSSSVRPVKCVISTGSGRPGSLRCTCASPWRTSTTRPSRVYVKGSNASSMTASCPGLNPVVSQST